jgi:hypothetical protein
MPQAQVVFFTGVRCLHVLRRGTPSVLLRGAGGGRVTRFYAFGFTKITKFRVKIKELLDFY